MSNSERNDLPIPTKIEDSSHKGVEEIIKFEQRNTESESDNEKNKDLIYEETTKLLDDKTDRLKTKINHLYEYYEKNNINDVFLKSEKEPEEDENTNKNEENTEKNCEGCKCLKIYLFGLLYFTFYLVGFFQLLDLFDACKKELGIIFKSFFYNTVKETNESF